MTINSNYSMIFGDPPSNTVACKIEYTGHRRAKASVEKPALRLIRELITRKVNSGFVLVGERVVNFIASPA